MRVAPDADPTDGMLEVVLIGQTSKLRFLSNLPKVFSAKHVELEGVKVFRAREVEIAANRPFDVYADGEVLTSLPATVRLIPERCASSRRLPDAAAFAPVPARDRAWRRPPDGFPGSRGAAAAPASRERSCFGWSPKPSACWRASFREDR